MSEEKDVRFSFDVLVNKSKKFNRDEFVINYGGLVEDVSEMLSNPLANSAVKYARDYIERVAEEKIGVTPRLQKMQFGNIYDAPELLRGEVAAVDGTPVLTLQKFSTGQALCTGIGSRSYTRSMDEVLHGYTSQAILGDLHPTQADDIREFFHRVQDGIYSISQTAYMRYFEAKHAKEIAEPYIFTDGTLLYEWLINQEKGRRIYKELLTQKKVLGVMKSLKESLYLLWLGRALNPGEVFIYQTVHDHVTDTSRVPRRDVVEQTQRDAQWERDEEFVALAKQVWRGVFKPADKAFGFECHVEHLPIMLRMMTADCQMNMPGHEIPFLLNEIDRDIRAFFKPDLVKAKIGQRMVREGEELFYEEGDERDFR